jgi:hypothetical protein
MLHRMKFINNTYHFIFFKRQHDACLGVIIFNLLYYSYISAEAEQEKKNKRAKLKEIF